MTKNDPSSARRLDQPASKRSVQEVEETANGELLRDGDQDLDLEVNRFLESEFFADHGYAIVSSSQNHANKPSATLLVIDELLFLDTDESIDEPDFGINDTTEAFGEFSATANSNAADDELCILFQPPTATATDAHEASGSLRVVIPATALLPPSPKAHRQHRQAKTSTPTSKQQTKGRKRVKDELEYLRQQVEEFERKLRRLKQERSSTGESPPFSPIISSLNRMETAPSDSSPDLTLWERTAKRQRDERRRSQFRNAKLKEMLEDQLQLVQSLSDVLQKREDLSWLESLAPGPSMYRRCKGSMRKSHQSDFDILAVQVETLYSELDAVLFETGLSGVETKAEVHSAQVKTDGNQDLYVEVVDCNTLPFDVHATDAAIWMLMSTSSIDFAGGRFQAIDATDDTIRAQLTVTLRMRRFDTSVRMNLVVKRVVEADRIVFVWCAKGETHGDVYENENVQVRESGWTIIKASNGADADTEAKSNRQQEPLTIVQNVVRMVPELETSGLSSESAENHVGVLTDVMLSSFRQNLAMLRQIIGNLIRSYAIQHKTSN